MITRTAERKNSWPETEHRSIKHPSFVDRKQTQINQQTITKNFPQRIKKKLLRKMHDVVTANANKILDALHALTDSPLKQNYKSISLNELNS